MFKNNRDSIKKVRKERQKDERFQLVHSCYKNMKKKKALPRGHDLAGVKALLANILGLLDLLLLLHGGGHDADEEGHEHLRAEHDEGDEVGHCQPAPRVRVVAV